MDIRHFLLAVIAGIMGTVAMTLTMYFYAYLSKHFTKVIHVLGNMLVGEESFSNPNKNALVLGSISHFSVGILFSLTYFLLWNWGVFGVNLIDAIILGSASGITAIAVWQSYLTLHANPPKLSKSHYFLALFIAHIIFAIVCIQIFRLLSDDPLFWFQLHEKQRYSQ